MIHLNIHDDFFLVVMIFFLCLALIIDSLNCSESVNNSSAGADSEGALRTSKSDTSLTDSFVMVNEADTKPKKINPQNILRDGFKWQRQLVFRSKLTMHTAYDRKDNAEPASITALAVSRCVSSTSYSLLALRDS